MPHQFGLARAPDPNVEARIDDAGSSKLRSVYLNILIHYIYVHVQRGAELETRYCSEAGFC
jgi:hypothetical protein